MECKISKLERAHFPRVFEIMQHFALESGIRALQNKEQYDYAYIQGILRKCEITGFSWVATSGQQIQGIFLSLIVPDLWMPRTLFLREIAWYVRPEWRNTTIGARLYSNYKRNAEQARISGRIAGYTMTRLASSPDFNYERGGFRFVESTYMIGD